MKLVFGPICDEIVQKDVTVGLLLVGFTKSQIYTKKGSGGVRLVFTYVTEKWVKNFKVAKFIKSVKFVVFVKNAQSVKDLMKLGKDQMMLIFLTKERTRLFNQFRWKAYTFAFRDKTHFLVDI